MADASKVGDAEPEFRAAAPVSQCLESPAYNSA
jgi:hypothetical protein